MGDKNYPLCNNIYRRNDAILLDVDYQDMEEMEVSVEEHQSEGDNTELQARDELALLGLAADIWASQDVQGMLDASQQVGMVGQPAPGSFQ